MRFILDAFAVATLGYLLCEIHDRYKAHRRYRAFQARCQKRLAEMYAVNRDPYDGRPV